jgi:hypothetical protein
MKSNVQSPLLELVAILKKKMQSEKPYKRDLGKTNEYFEK